MADLPELLPKIGEFSTPQGFRPAHGLRPAGSVFHCHDFAFRETTPEYGQIVDGHGPLPTAGAEVQTQAVAHSRALGELAGGDPLAVHVQTLAAGGDGCLPLHAGWLGVEHQFAAQPEARPERLAFDAPRKTAADLEPRILVGGCFIRAAPAGAEDVSSETDPRLTQYPPLADNFDKKCDRRRIKRSGNPSFPSSRRVDGVGFIVSALVIEWWTEEWGTQSSGI